MLRIKQVKYVNEYKLELLFNNEEKKIVDFHKWINEGGFYIHPLKELKYFKKVKLDEFYYTICWPNGANFSPDVLYEAGKDLQEENKQSNVKIKRRKLSIEKKTEFKYKVTTKAKKISKRFTK